MIELAIIHDETRMGKRRAAGRMLRHRVHIAVDRFNVVVAESTDDGNAVGKKFVARLSQLEKLILPEYGIATDIVAQKVGVSLSKFLNQPIKETMTLSELDTQFCIGKRTKGSSGELYLYQQLKKSGLVNESDNEEEDGEDEDEEG